MLRWNDTKVIKDMRKAAIAGVKRVTLAIERDVKLLIKKKGIQRLSLGLAIAEQKLLQAAKSRTASGRQKQRRVHSKPGDPPFRQTGMLVSSYGHEFHEGGLLGIAGTNLKYARWLELGTSKMAARPHLRPTYDAVIAKWPKYFTPQTTTTV